MTEQTEPRPHATAQVSVVAGTRVVLGESPLWLAERERLVYVDMVGGAVHEHDLRTGAHDARVGAPYLGAVVATRSGGLACVTVDGVAMLDGDRVTPLVTILTDDDTRLNDAACDPWGRLWVGSTSRADLAGVGALHVWEPGSKPVTVLTGLTQPNGIGWSPDRRSAYVVDTGRSIVLRAATHPETGVIGDFEAFANLGGSLPDGLAVAADGSIWIAMWDGGRLDRFDRQGALLESVALPVARPTSCAFVGSERLAVTSASFGLDAADDAAGAVLLVDVGVDGAPVGRLAA